MNVFDFAIEMETDGESYYRKLAAQTRHGSVAGVLTLLAQEEVKHRDILEKIRDGLRPKMSCATFREGVKNLFVELAESGADVSGEPQTIDLYRHAQDLETRSREFYTEQAREVSDPAIREIILKLADEERLHFLMLGTLIEFVARAAPGNWLENAEWYHMDEY